MVVFPNAKINLGLYVTERRPDGYHNLETVMIPVPAKDLLEITLSTGDTDRLVTSGRPVNCLPEKNLVMKAIRRLRRSCDFPPLDIHLNKQIPDGAGLGGGSADASFALKAVNEMCNCGLSDEELASMAAEIGADCPFFIYNRPLVCTGIGDIMAPIDLQLPPDLWILLVKPSVSVPTKEAYAGLTPKAPEFPLVETLRLPMDCWQGKLTNDFEPTVFARYPQVGAVKEGMIGAGAIYASMSGSGSAVFGFFDRELTEQEIKPLCPDGCYLFSKIS